MVNTVTVFFLIVQGVQIKSLRAQLSVRQATPERVAPRAPDVEPDDPNAFAGVTESMIPGRYKWFQSGQEKGIITLFADHTFSNEKGEKFSAYHWELGPDALVLIWQSGLIRYTRIESNGVYVGLRTDQRPERMEKLD